MVGHQATFLITKVMLEILPSKWHYCSLHGFAVPYSINGCVLGQYRWFCVIVKCFRHVGGTTTSLYLCSLTFFQEVLPGHSMKSFSSSQKADMIWIHFCNSVKSHKSPLGACVNAARYENTPRRHYCDLLGNIFRIIFVIKKVTLCFIMPG